MIFVELFSPLMLGLFALFCACAFFMDYLESDGFWLGIPATGILLAIGYFVTDPHGQLYHWSWDNFAYWWVAGAGYLAIGLVFSILKWWRYQHLRVEAWKEENANSSVGTGYYYDRLGDFLKGKESKNKATIIFWIAYWPIVALFSLLNDPLVKLCHYVYTLTQGVYRRITDYVQKDLREELDQYNNNPPKKKT